MPLLALPLPALPRVAVRHRLPERDQLRVGQVLRAEYERGVSIRALGESTGYSIGRVRRLLTASGVVFRARGGYHAR